MGRYVFRLPDVGEGTAEAEIAAWHVRVGDRVAEDQPLVDVTTDKATVEISSPVAGTVLATNGAPGEKLAIGSELVVLQVDGEGDGEAEAAPTRAAEAAPAAAAAATPPQPAQRQDQAQARAQVRTSAAAPPAAVRRPPGERPAASPAVRQRARDLGIDLRLVAGSGPAGRITHADLDGYAAGPATPAAGLARRDGVQPVQVIGIRRTIARRMQEAKRRIPHYSYIEEVDVSALEALRATLNATRPAEARLTVLPFLLRALAVALPEHPEINARFDDEAGVVERHEALHAGIATQTPNGLLVPVLRHAEALDLDACAAEIRRLSAAARDGKAGRDDLYGSTITITSLGALGGLATTPVINRPEVAIVGVNKIAERPVIRDGQVVARKMMNLSCSFDHRVIDGWVAAEFVQRLRQLLEQPALLFVS